MPYMDCTYQHEVHQGIVIVDFNRGEATSTAGNSLLKYLRTISEPYDGIIVDITGVTRLDPGYLQRLTEISTTERGKNKPFVVLLSKPPSGAKDPVARRSFSKAYSIKDAFAMVREELANVRAAAH
jgi:hypothetical protein